MNEFGAHIAKYRTNLGMTQRQFAELVGLQQSAIARLETGERNPTITTLIKLSRGTGIEFIVEISEGKINIKSR